MVGNDTAVTAEPARKSAPQVSRRDAAAAAAEAARAGKVSPERGEGLPPPEPKTFDAAKAVQRLNELSIQARRDLHFRVDEASGRTIITVINAATAEVVRQIPAEEILAFARAFEENGGLLDAIA